MFESRLSEVLVSQQTHVCGAKEYGYTMRDGRVSTLSLDYASVVSQMRRHWPDLINDLSGPTRSVQDIFGVDDRLVSTRSRRRVYA